MPIDLPKLLADQLDAILTADATVAGLVKAGNRIRLSRKGTLRELIAASPSDWPQYRINADPTSSVQRFTHSLLALPLTLGTEHSEEDDPTDFTAELTRLSKAGVFIERRTDVVVTLREETKNDSDDTSLMESVLLAIVKAGPTLKLPSLISRVDPITNGTRRATRDKELPNPGIVTVIPLTIWTQQKLADVLA